MTEFALVLILFVGSHVFPAATGLRERLMLRFGRPLYLTVYSGLSVVLLIWLVSAASRAPYIGVWQTTRYLVVGSMALNLLAAILLACGVLRANPLSISLQSGPTDVEHPGVLAVTRHPILWALFLWALAHCLVNGDVVSLTMFGGFALLCVVSRPVLEKRAARRLGLEGYRSAMAVREGDLSQRLGRAASRQLAMEIIAGIVVFGLMLMFHEALLGVDPLVYL
ncbi:NnrU family protein [Hoeflea prorocentri]|uniref:NnrU family protein n=1 Tax=Hoeflea prorocentri TaxID=1922333 RepID=A0A9X3UD26_9HYPH|nr:NnrU family protein [Hoeflea prorocentri]MCY6379172.1 NnrU family protein [Hoeflea prorocentri]MDA5396973.1 NnrU family protein [Hoeflea prorocentri]